MENTDRNRVDYSSHPEWLWPAYKFDLDPDDQFTTLHEQFNTWRMPLQNAHAFHADLSDLAHAHTTKDNLLQALEQRRQLRSKEMLVAWEEIALALGMKESILESNDRWAKFTQLSRTRALDAFLAFLYTFLPEHEKGLVDTDVSKRIEAETGSRGAAADTPRERVNLANKGGVVDESKRHNPGHPRRWNTEGGQDVDDLASIPSTTSCFNGMEVDVDKDWTSVSPLPKYISTEGTVPPISYKVPRSDIVLGPECPTRHSRLRQSSNRVSKRTTTPRPSTDRETRNSRLKATATPKARYNLRSRPVESDQHLDRRKSRRCG